MSDQEREGRPREPEVEAHGLLGESEEAKNDPEDRVEEEEGDVEAHIKARRPQTR